MYLIQVLGLSYNSQTVLEYNGIVFVYQLEALKPVELRHLKFITNRQIKEIREKLEAFNKEA
jgi:hypothetical protein